MGFIRFVSVEIYEPLKWIEKSCSKGALLLRVSVSVTWNSCLWGYQSCQNWLGDFLKWGYPISWMVYKGTSFLEIDDLGVTPWLRKPPNDQPTIPWMIIVGLTQSEALSIHPWQSSTGRVHRSVGRGGAGGAYWEFHGGCYEKEDLNQQWFIYVYFN